MALLKRQDTSQLGDLKVQDVHTILGPESKFEGKLVFEGTVRIDGEFKGEVHTDNMLVIGHTAKVEARLCVGSIIINGEVIGDIIAQQCVEIHAPGRVRGNIQTPQLYVAKGVIFEGLTKMHSTTRLIEEHSITLLTGGREG